MTRDSMGAAPVNAERRRFLELSGRFGTTAALAGLAGGVFYSDEAMAQVANEEKARERAAEHRIVMATEYIPGATRTYPLMQLDFKENLQNLTGGKLYVKLAPGGQLGVGSALVGKVQSGTVAIAQHSISNFSPFAPAVDLINIPYWCGSNQQMVNLVTSAAWQQTVHPQVEAKGFKPLMYVCIDPRTVAIRKGLRETPVAVPEDIAGIKFRVPASRVLQQFYQLAGANPTPVPWGETSSAMKQGVADALDPSIQALQIFGFGDTLHAVSMIRSVPDAQIYSCNLKWFESLPQGVRHGVLEACEVTFAQNLAKVPAARAYARYELERQGVKIYVPSAAEQAQWVARCGHQLAAWDEMKQAFAGSLAAFERLREAANTAGSHRVSDV
jgi:TRAP-type C4-dicarboxylate transport system substrate-binding protein